MATYVDMAAAQFENLNELRLYPFADGSSLKDRQGRDLPLDTISDVHMVVPSGISNPDSGLDESNMPVVRLASVHMSATMVSVCFVSDMDGARQALSVTVARDGFRPYFPYRLEKLSGSYDIGGAVTFGDFDFPGFPETYFLDGAVIHPCCVAVAKPPELRSFVDRRSGESVSGDVDIRFSSYVEHEKYGKNFRLSLEPGAYKELMSACADMSSADVCGATPIVSINGVAPDSEGNIVLWFH